MVVTIDKAPRLVLAPSLQHKSLDMFYSGALTSKAIYTLKVSTLWSFYRSISALLTLMLRKKSTVIARPPLQDEF